MKFACMMVASILLTASCGPWYLRHGLATQDLKNPQNVHKLIKAFASPDADEALKVVVALGPQVISPLVEYGNSPAVGSYVAKALRQILPAASTAQVVELLEHGFNEEARDLRDEAIRNISAQQSDPGSHGWGLWGDVAALSEPEAERDWIGGDYTAKDSSEQTLKVELRDEGVNQDKEHTRDVVLGN